MFLAEIGLMTLYDVQSIMTRSISLSTYKTAIHLGVSTKYTLRELLVKCELYVPVGAGKACQITRCLFWIFNYS
jgi:hypothetical protein